MAAIKSQTSANGPSPLTSPKTKGRIARTPVDVLDATADLDQPRIEGAMVAMQAQAIDLRAQEDLQLAQASQAVGGALMARLHKNFSLAAEVAMFMQVRELPLAVLRRLPIPDFCAAAQKIPADSQASEEKTCAAAQTLEEFCMRVFGRSYRAMAEAAQNLSLLGEEAYETAARLGLNRSALRLTRTLPPEKLALVREAIGTGSTKAEVLSVIEDLAERAHQAEAAVEEAKAELAAKDELLGAKNKKIDELHAAKRRIARATPDEALADLKKEATQCGFAATAAVVGNLRLALQALRDHDNEAGTQGGNDLFMASLASEVKLEAQKLLDHFMLPDLSDAAELQLQREVQAWSTQGHAQNDR